jgi:heme/copper-type cytochrome/quinol oxidase subunit 2
MVAAVFSLLFLLVALCGFLFWLWMLIDCATKEPDQGNTKIVWIIIIVFTNLVGALVYFFVQRAKRMESYYAGADPSRPDSSPL